MDGNRIVIKMSGFKCNSKRYKIKLILAYARQQTETELKMVYVYMMHYLESCECRILSLVVIYKSCMDLRSVMSALYFYFLI